MKVIWKDYRKNIKYITNAAFADLPMDTAKEGRDYKATFTVESEDHDGLLSMEKLFLSYYRDPTEYSFVQDVFDGDIKHWEIFKNSKWINEYYTRWKQLATLKLASEATAKIVGIAFDDSNKNQLTALKYLVEKDNKSTSKQPVGRPKKEKRVEEVDSRDLLADIERLKA